MHIYIVTIDDKTGFTNHP